MPPDDEPSHTITTKEAAALLMVSTVWVGKLADQGYVEKVGRGRWDLANVVQGYIRWLKDEDRRSSKTATASRMQEVKTARLEMQMAKERHELVPIEDVMLVLDTMTSLTKSSVMSVAARYTRDIPERRRLERILVEALDGIARGMEKKADALANGGDVME